MLCDKCNKEVSENNSVIEFFRLHMHPALCTDYDRHLYPENGCEGSPSRVKIIEESSMTKEEYFKVIDQENKEYLKIKRSYGL